MRIGVRFLGQSTFSFRPQPVALLLSLVLLSACNPTINDKKGEEYVAAVNAKKGAAAFADLTGQIANSQFPDGVVTAGKIDSAYTSTLATKTYADSYMLGYALPAISTFTSGDTIRWNTTTKSWEVFTPSAAAIAAGSITTTEILDGTVATADLAADAVTSAKILDGAIMNADINAAAAIDGSKVTPAFGAQNISTTGTLGSGAITSTGAISGTTITGSGALSGASISTTGNASFGGTLGVTGNTTLSGTLSAGATTLSGALALGANNLTSTGSATFASLTLSSTPLAVSSGGTGLATVGTANYVFASPSGATGAPAFRALVAADMPAFTGGDVTTSAGSGATAIGANKVLTGMIKDGEIVDADINASAAIAVTKLAASGTANETRFLTSANNAAPTFTDTSVFVKNSKVFSNNIIRDQSRGLVITTTSTTALTVIADEVSLQNSSGVGVRVAVASKTIDGTASGLLGLDTGVIAAGWYYIWIVYDPTNDLVSAVLSASSSAPSPPAAYTYYGLVGAIYTSDATPTFSRIYQAGNQVRLLSAYTSAQITGLAASTCSAITALSLTDVVPPTAKEVKSHFEYCGSMYLSFYGDSSGNYAQEFRDIYANGGCWSSSATYTVPLITAQTIYRNQCYYGGTGGQPDAYLIKVTGWTY